ncbi:hypothetical protein HPB48_004004 [Haemaphysalis longicornis]|uniref:Uncharacterized protein n=1 Tax=Haemaphysalis longicornis TaxID=44386 RepID=A0A9J6FYI7_HAELO|nr:hypothetical protein HPB48_004004 [Haemaphysalis longicornis]
MHRLTCHSFCAARETPEGQRFRRTEAASFLRASCRGARDAAAKDDRVSTPGSPSTWTGSPLTDV